MEMPIKIKKKYTDCYYNFWSNSERFTRQRKMSCKMGFFVFFSYEDIHLTGHRKLKKCINMNMWLSVFS